MRHPTQKSCENMLSHLHSEKSCENMLSHLHSDDYVSASMITEVQPFKKKNVHRRKTLVDEKKHWLGWSKKKNFFWFVRNL